MTPKRAAQSRRRHRYPRCAATGLSRFGERKDARLAIEASQRTRGRAVLGNGVSTWNDLRCFKCGSCRGFHLVMRAGA